MSESSGGQVDRQERNKVFGGREGVAQSVVPSSSVMVKDFGYEIPVEAIPLPSRGIVYPVNSILHGMDTVNIRAMTAKEEDLLTSRALIKQGTMVTRLLQNCIVDSGINPDMMLSGDRNALLVAIRITGYGTEYPVTVNCPSCGERAKQTFDLSELPIKRLEIDPVEPGENVFEFELPVIKKVAKFRFMTGRAEREMVKQLERNKKMGAKADSTVTTLLQHQLLSVGDVTDRGKLQIFIQQMPARDSKALRNYIEQHEPGIEMKGWFECNSCFESSEVRLPLGASFFWPDAE